MEHRNEPFDDFPLWLLVTAASVAIVVAPIWFLVRCLVFLARWQLALLRGDDL